MPDHMSRTESGQSRIHPTSSPRLRRPRTKIYGDRHTPEDTEWPRPLRTSNPGSTPPRSSAATCVSTARADTQGAVFVPHGEDAVVLRLWRSRHLIAVSAAARAAISLPRCSVHTPARHLTVAVPPARLGWSCRSRNAIPTSTASGASHDPRSKMRPTSCTGCCARSARWKTPPPRLRVRGSSGPEAQRRVGDARAVRTHARAGGVACPLLEM